MEWKDLTLEHYLDELAKPNPTPAGGSACAVAGAMAASLCALVAGLGAGKGHVSLISVEEEAGRLRSELLHDAQRDSDAYAAYLLERRRAQGRDSLSAQNEALALAAQIPLDVASRSQRVIELIKLALPLCSAHAKPDGMAGIALAQAAIQSSLVNARINTSLLSDPIRRKDLMHRVDEVELNGATHW